MQIKTTVLYLIRYLKNPVCLIFLSFFFILPSSFAANVKTDLRVIVDISGSMKKTDPNNLRRPAVRLLAGLIPDGSRAGIWNFGQQVNMAVKIGDVDDNWREQARNQSKKISSVGLYTNIENAMRKASFDWKQADPRYERNLILLTDGHVDISQDGKQNTASRKRIIKEILPALELAKVRIHTIALSDDVDESLLSTLSAYTDGLYKKVSNADDLQKLFLQMLEQSVKLDSIPLDNNSFNVDSSINDMTLLVFNKEISTPTKIVTPSKKIWTEKTSSANVKWFNDQGFDLITIKKPQQGRWRIISPVDKNNRVVVATNLKLLVNDLPGYLMLGDLLKVDSGLEQDGKPLTDQRLLSKFKFSLIRTVAGSAERQYPMSNSADDSTKYSYQLPPIFKPGDNELVIRAKSPTAEREVRHRFTVYATPAEIKISEKQDKYQIEVTPYANLLRPDSVKVSIELQDKSKHTLTRHDNHWLLDVDRKFSQTMYTLNINAIRADGKPIAMSFNKKLDTHQAPQVLKLAGKKQQKHETKTIKKDKKDKSKAKEKETEKDAQKEAEINWTVVILSIVFGNLLLLVLLGGGFYYLKRRKEKLSQSLQADMAEEEVPEKENPGKEIPEKEDPEKETAESENKDE